MPIPDEFVQRHQGGSLISHPNALDRYRSSIDPAPTSNLGWNMYGPGVESIGREGAPEEMPVSHPGSDQLLVRVDAVGLCYSDVKLINQGGSHPKLYDRDLATEPTRLGHEAVVTVVEVGAGLAGSYEPGQRLVIQPDIYVDGRSTAYGYTIPGGLIQYHLIGPEVLDADDGSYVIPVDDSVGYVSAALSEPWACVVASYTQRRRLTPKAGGTMWIVGHGDDSGHYEFSSGLDAPSRIVLTDVPSQIADLVEDRRSDTSEVIIRNGLSPADFEAVDEEITNGEGFDDIVLLDVTSADVVEKAATRIAFRGTMNLVGTRHLDGTPRVDAGRIHYDYTAYLGTSGSDIAGSYGESRNRCELAESGVAVFVGAGGPMGQMHTQRALEQPDGPRTVIATDLDQSRLDVLKDRLDPLAKEKGRQFIVVNSTEDSEAVRRHVAEQTNGLGADDVVVTVPVAGVIEEAASLLGPSGMLVLFAGVPNGTLVSVALDNVYLGNVQLTGTSGSKVSDQALLLNKVVAGSLSPQRSLAAVGGMQAAVAGVEAMIEGRFAGKIVIFPQFETLPLMGLEELGQAHPEIGEKLVDGQWTSDAEVALVSEFWDG